MIKIFPNIEFKASCPVDRTELNITDVIIPGMRSLADAFCPTCFARYYIDLPVGQALWAPIILNQKTGEIYDTFNDSWFSDPFKEGFLNPVKDDIIPITFKFFDTENIVIVNCLDFLYGHSLLKLLNIQRYLDNNHELGCCVLVPTQLKHLVPDGVAEIWEFPVKIQDGWKWYPSLQYWISQKISQYKECFLSPAYSHPSNQVYDLHRFVRNLPDISEEIKECHPVILFSYREDRLWGKTLSHQQSNIQRLYNQLAEIFPDMAFVIAGFGHQNKIYEKVAKLIDIRIHKFDMNTDRLWMSYMSKADCAVGVHGSNMLLPSGLAKATVELVPRSRLGNTIQDLLFPYHYKEPREGLLFYRMLYGNETLSDIRISCVTDLIVCCISYSPANNMFFNDDKIDVEKVRENWQNVSNNTIFREAVSYLTTIPVKYFVLNKLKKSQDFLPLKITKILDKIISIIF